MPGTLLAIADPLLDHGLDTTVVLIIIGKTIAVFVLLLLSVLMYIWFLRKVIAKMQNRIGPDRAGPFGLLQSLADGIKLFFKEHSTPTTADRCGQARESVLLGLGERSGEVIVEVHPAAMVTGRVLIAGSDAK